MIQALDDVLATLRGKASGKFYHEPTDQYLFVGSVMGKPKLLGVVSGRLHLQDPRGAELIERRIWSDYFHSVLELSDEN